MKNPKGLLTAETVNKDGADKDRGTSHSHCGVVVGQTEQFYKIKNSWGNGFADQGYFNVKKDALGDRLKFIFIWHNYTDLRESDHYNWACLSHQQKEEWLKTHYDVYGYHKNNH